MYLNGITMNKVTVLAVVFLFSLLRAELWDSLAPGMELRWLKAIPITSIGDSGICVVRIDPAFWQMEFIGVSAANDTISRTARQWAQGYGLAIAINAGMYATDYKTHVGYTEIRGQVISRRINVYQSIAAFDPKDPRKARPFRIFDLDQPGVTVQSIRRDYASLVQNLRLVKRPGENRWEKQEKEWSETALGEDRKGRILFVFCRSPVSMYDFNRELLAADIGLVALQHLEGGPQAQLFLKAGDFELEMSGNYTTFLNENKGNTTPPPIPNVLGMRRKAKGS